MLEGEVGVVQKFVSD